MLRYVVHDDDGRIVQANKVYDPTGYPNVLHDNGVRHVILPGVGGLPDMDGSFVNVATGQVVKRPPMMPQVSKTTISADGGDCAEIINLPPGSRVTVRFDGLTIADEINNDGGLQIRANMRGVYEITVEKFPFRPWTAKVMAV